MKVRKPSFFFFFLEQLSDQPNQSTLTTIPPCMIGQQAQQNHFSFLDPILQIGLHVSGLQTLQTLRLDFLGRRILGLELFQILQ
jgi:hypothetical protein